MLKILARLMRVLLANRLTFHVSDDDVVGVVYSTLYFLKLKVNVTDIVDKFKEFEVGVDTLYLHSIFKEPPAMPPRLLDVVIELHPWKIPQISHGPCAKDPELEGNLVCIELPFVTEIDSQRFDSSILFTIQFKKTQKFTRPLVRQMMIQKGYTSDGPIDPQKLVAFLNRIFQYMSSPMNVLILSLWNDWQESYSKVTKDFKIEHRNEAFWFDIEFPEVSQKKRRRSNRIAAEVKTSQK